MILDVILVLVILYIIFNIFNKTYTISGNDISNDLSTNLLSNNIIFDDDIIILNNEKSNKKIKETFENKINETKPVNNIIVKNDIDKNINEIFDIPDNTLEKQLLDNSLLSKSDNKNIELSFLPKYEGRVNNRYNKKYDKIPKEQELYDIRKYAIKNTINLDDDEWNKINKKNNIETVSKFKNNIDDKIFNKSNKSQKLFKDSKTIAGRFTKNSIINDYKYELDYYENLRTPWWVDNVN